MIELKAGDILRATDLKRRTLLQDSINKPHGYEKRYITNMAMKQFTWYPTDLIGTQLLRSDLMVFEYARP